LGAYRAWQEAILSDPALSRKQQHIHAWTTARVTAVFELLSKVHGARTTVDVPALARVMDGFFWSLLARAAKMRKAELNQWIDARRTSSITRSSPIAGCESNPNQNP
jgi:hypothetical protein